VHGGWVNRAGASLRGVVAALVVGCNGLASPGPQRPAPNLGAFVPAPIEVVEQMLRLAEVTKDDVVYNLGSGDGRIVNLAADRYGAHGVRVEIDPQLVWSSRQRAQRADRASREAPERTCAYCGPRVGHRRRALPLAKRESPALPEAGARQGAERRGAYSLSLADRDGGPPPWARVADCAQGDTLRRGVG
jgi:hypothetical protein